MYFIKRRQNNSGYNKPKSAMRCQTVEAKLQKIITIPQSKVILIKAVEKIQCVENPVSNFTVQQSAIFGYNILRLRLSST